VELDESDWYPASEKPKLSIPHRYQIVAGPGFVALRLQAIDPPPLKGWGAQLSLSPEDCRLLGTHLLDAADLLDGMKGQKN
jgi:hypothetical protein